MDFIGREAIFKRLIEQDRVTGVPGNPELEELVVNESGDYDEAFEELVQTRIDAQEIYDRIWLCNEKLALFSPCGAARVRCLASKDLVLVHLLLNSPKIAHCVSNLTPASPLR